ncbi:unnamed protein product [Echinostoma caproni]|uniref:GOST seven transmembrane domain-containing protein n=1 Tax=Echinostoma caproni TaxID=27848 RepID=A0A3P8ISY9_9TREM|nr:unnamed protein product [Echinostoma caproni]
MKCFCLFLVSLAFMIWSVMVFKRHFCIENWSYLWIDSAFWQVLFLVILGVIIILWRPTASNREYAYSLLDVPTPDTNDDDDEEVLLEQLAGEEIVYLREAGKSTVNKERLKCVC